MEDEKVTAQSTVQDIGIINKNGRIYNYDTVQKAIRNSNIEKLQLSTMYGMFGEYGTFDKSKEIKVSRIEDLDDHNGFKPGYLYCIQRQLEGSLCEKCESRDKCIEDKKEERLNKMLQDSMKSSFDIHFESRNSLTMDEINEVVRRFQEKYGD